MRNKDFYNKISSVSRQKVFGITLCATIIIVLSDLAFSVRTYHDIVMFFILLIVFAYNVICDIKENKKEFIKKIKDRFYSAKWLYVVLILYYVYDIITIIYAKNYTHALLKLPRMLEYTVIFVAGVYYCTSVKHLKHFMISVALSGTIVSIGTYIYYFCSLNPIYFQRLSTARDYNVYACLILISFIFLSDIIISCTRISYLKRLLIFTFFALVNIPTFYFAGSRRIFIMMPYFFTFAVLYEAIRLIFLQKDKMKSLAHSLSYLSVCVVIYFSCIALLPSFTQFGEQKEKNYKNYVKQIIDSGQEFKKKPNSTNEKTIINIIESIDNKTMYNKRSIIYSVALKEVKTYSFTDLVFGRGAAYDIHLYDVTQNEELLDAYNISEKNPRRIGWLSAHNFMLADLLNGGIIKLLLGFVLAIEIIIHAIIATYRRKQSGILFGIAFSLILSNNFISGAYGMLNDVFFQTLMISLCSVLYLYRKGDFNAKNKLGLHNDKCSSL